MAIGNARLDANRQADENCLKVILSLHLETGRAHMTDIATAMEIPVSTVYSTVNRLVEAGYLTLQDRKGKQSAELTNAGINLAKQVLEKHQQIYQWLLCLGIPEEEADEEACHWEHSITPRTMTAIQRHVAMAMRAHGHPEEGVDEGAPDLSQEAAMGEMDKIVAVARDTMGQTTPVQLLGLLSRCGGAQGLDRKIELSRRAGGDENLEALTDLLESLGGPGALPELQDHLTRVRTRGGFKACREEAALVDALGGSDQLRKLKKLADKIGGMSSVLALLRNNYRLWSAALGARRSEDEELEDEREVSF